MPELITGAQLYARYLLGAVGLWPVRWDQLSPQERNAWDRLAGALAADYLRPSGPDMGLRAAASLVVEEARRDRVRSQINYRNTLVSNKALDDLAEALGGPLEPVQEATEALPRRGVLRRALDRLRDLGKEQP